MMGIFGKGSPFDVDIDKATSEKNTTEPWDLIMDICDRASASSKNAKDCLRSVIRRLSNNDPHVALQAIILLDACINNCGKTFHLEIASREFETEFKKLLGKGQPQVALKLRLSLKKWAENEFKTDAELNLIPALYNTLKNEGHVFTDTSASHSQEVKKQQVNAAVKADPFVVSSQEEEDDIAKAIELSLKDKSGSSPKVVTSSSSTVTNSASSNNTTLYPTMNNFHINNPFGGATNAGNSGGSASANASAQEPESRKVRALYDFEAAEDNELTFLTGEIIHVTDSSDPNWWKGFNSRGEGLFPSNFVTSDLNYEPESAIQNVVKNQQSGGGGQNNDSIKTDNETTDQNYVIEINEEKIDRLLHLLHEANPEDPSQDSEEMIKLEEQVNHMLPLIDTELEGVDRKHAQLTLLSSDLVEAINLYHTLMKEPDRSAMDLSNYSQHHMGGMMQQFPGQGQHSMYSTGGIGVPQQQQQQPHMSSLANNVPGPYNMSGMYQMLPNIRPTMNNNINMTSQAPPTTTMGGGQQMPMQLQHHFQGPRIHQMQQPQQPQIQQSQQMIPSHLQNGNSMANSFMNHSSQVPTSGPVQHQTQQIPPPPPLPTQSSQQQQQQHHHQQQQQPHIPSMLMAPGMLHNQNLINSSQQNNSMASLPSNAPLSVTIPMGQQQQQQQLLQNNQQMNNNFPINPHFQQGLPNTVNNNNNNNINHQQHLSHMMPPQTTNNNNNHNNNNSNMIMTSVNAGLPVNNSNNNPSIPTSMQSNMFLPQQQQQHLQMNHMQQLQQQQQQQPSSNANYPPPHIMASVTQPVTTTILQSQSDSRMNIPIYQQQR